jgi:hypothetical protein
MPLHVHDHYMHVHAQYTHSLLHALADAASQQGHALPNAAVRTCCAQDGNTALHHAASAGNMEAVQLLLDSGVLVGAVNKVRSSAHRFSASLLLWPVHCALVQQPRKGTSHAWAHWPAAPDMLVYCGMLEMS